MSPKFNHPDRLHARSVPPVYVRTLLILISAGFALLEGCSLVYSPFVTPASRPLLKGEGGVTASVNLLPETRPEMTTRYVSSGGDLTARYAFSDRLTLQARAWSRLTDVGDAAVDGFSLEATYMLSDSQAATRFGLIPRIAAMTDGNEIKGRAALMSGVAWLPDFWIIHPYVALGAGIGDYIGDESSSYAGRWGFTFINNLGGNVDLFSNFNAGLELATVLQFNQFDRSHQLLPFLPSLTLGWKF